MIKKLTLPVFSIEVTEHERGLVYTALVDFLEDLPYQDRVFSKDEKALYSLFIVLCKKFVPRAYGSEKKRYTINLKYHLAIALNRFCSLMLDRFPGAFVFGEISSIIDPKL